jgi:2-C-methyl-D-erythritol 2,4-cyclodiphosphate synthase
MVFRIGLGYDIHRLESGRKLFLGGIEIPYVKGLLGHSDGDGLLHAICDALLGAAALGDIGEHFPDTDPAYDDIDSAQLLSRVMEMVRGQGFVVGNVDVVVICEEPKLGPFKKQIKQRISTVLGIDAGQVNIKAKTNEKLDELGEKKAIACQAVVLIYK